MRRGRILALVLLTLECLLLSPSQHAQNQGLTFDELVKAHSYSMEMADGKLSGPGFDFLLNESAEAQFFVIGEEHVVTEIPQFTTAMFSVLHSRFGYNYLALELGPVMGGMFSEPRVARRRDSVTSMAKRYPNGLQFVTDQELEMIAHVSALSSGKGKPIWGCDQEFGALHVLEKLEPLALSRGARSEIRRLIEEAREYEGERFRKNVHYMYALMKPERAQALEKLYRPRKRSEAEFLLSQLRVSAEIYAARGFEGNYRREENMKDLFMREYRRAREKGERFPKAVLKLGHWHTYRGFGPNRISTLGDFVAQFAKSNGTDSFQLAILITGTPEAWRSIAKDSDLNPLSAAVSAERWTIVDFRPLRRHIYAGRIKDLAPKLQNYIFGFDAALLMTGARPATYELIKTPAFRDWPEE